MSTAESSSKIRWVPLEANPEVWNKYMETLGVPAVAGCQFQDVWSLEPDMLGFVPKPVLAVILLFPLSKDDKTNPTDGLGTALEKIPDTLYYIKQTVGNACGTMAILHSLTNNTEKLAMGNEAFLARFIAATKSMGPDDKAAYFEKDAEFSGLHGAAAQQGQTDAPAEDHRVEPHYVAFVQHGGRLVELDGRKAGPVDHGATTAGSLLEDTAEVAKKVIQRAAGSLQFSVIALVAPSAE